MNPEIPNPLSEEPQMMKIKLLLAAVLLMSGCVSVGRYERDREFDARRGHENN